MAAPSRSAIAPRRSPSACSEKNLRSGVSGQALVADGRFPNAKDRKVSFAACRETETSECPKGTHIAQWQLMFVPGKPQVNVLTAIGHNYIGQALL